MIGSLSAVPLERRALMLLLRRENQLPLDGGAVPPVGDAELVMLVVLVVRLRLGLVVHVQQHDAGEVHHQPHHGQGPGRVSTSTRSRTGHR